MAAGANASYGIARKLAQAKAREFSLVSEFKLGYRNREDITNLPPGVLIVGSKNVLTNVSERIQMRKGYALDGELSSLAGPVLSSFDWLTRGNGEVHMRAGGLTNALVATGAIIEIQGGFEGGTGYVFGDILTIDGGNGLSTIVVLAIDDDGAILTVKIVTPGAGYTNNTEYNGTGGTGTGAVFQVTTGTIGDGKLQYRYVDSFGIVTWRDLLTDLVTVSYNFAKYWNVTENLREVLFVNGTSNIFRWNGATAFVASNTATTLTKTGTESWLDAGFYTTADKIIVIDGVEYSYSGGEDTTTLTGLTGLAPVTGNVVHQQVVTVANTDMDGIPATFPNSLIETLNNQVFVGALTSSALYISYVNSYTDYTSSDPRQSGEGAVLILDDNLVGLKPQENFMYVTCGQDLWYNVNFEIQTSTVGVTYEQVNALPLKTGRRQAAISQAFLSHMKNNIIVVTQETTIDTFGRVETSLATPQTTNISDPIKLDIDSYDFTDGSIAYHRFYIYVAVPKEGVVLVYNIATKSWESPQSLPISRFYIVNGELYGHSYNTFESYQLFTGYADRVHPEFNGYPIAAVAKFSYQNYGSRSTYKKANYLYVEGYISSNTNLTATITYELDGCSTVKNLPISGNAAYVCLLTETGSLGKVSLGKSKLGGAGVNSINNLPPKFRVEKSFNNTNFFEMSPSFSCQGINQRFELLAFGLNASQAPEEPVRPIRD